MGLIAFHKEITFHVRIRDLNGERQSVLSFSWEGNVNLHLGGEGRSE